MACLANIETNIVTDQSALVALKEHILSDPSLVLEDYRTANTSVCDWIGVTCGIQHHRVSALNLSFMGLKGSNPRHLGNLSFLVSLDLSGNNFQANQPGDLSRLRRLWFMNFKLNNFTGDNPSWFGSFPELKFLSIRNNSFTGFIPHSLAEHLEACNIGTVIQSFTKLRFLK